MKPQLLTICFVISATLSLSAQISTAPFTHSVTRLATSAGAPLTNTEEKFNYYDNNGHLYEAKNNHWDGADWGLANREYYTLNPQGLPTQILVKDWNAATSVLKDSRRITFEYDANGQEIYRKEETWNSATHQWRVMAVTTATFSPGNNLLEYTSKYYEGTTVLSGSHLQYFYDGNDRVSMEIFQNWNNGNWLNQQKTDFAYNGTDEDYSISTVQFWDGNAWGPVNSRTTQTVTPAEREWIYEYFNGSSWSPSVRTNFKYNPDGQLGVYRVDGWSDATSSWITSTRYYYTYNNDQSVVKTSLYTKEGTTNDLYLQGTIDYDYNTYLVETKTPELQVRLSVFPNPTVDFVRLELDRETPSKLSLLDLQGNVVFSTTTASNIAQLSLAGQPAGVYLLRVEQGGAVKVLPVLKR